MADTIDDPKRTSKAAKPRRAPAAAKAEPAKRGRPKASATKARQALPKIATLRLKLKEQKQNFIQEQILEVAAELIAAGGFRAVTIDDISASLGFSKSVIYYYLEGKNDILWRIFSRIYETYFESLSRIDATDAEPDAKLYEMIRMHATNVMTYRAWTAISLREEAELEDGQRKQIVRRKRDYDAIIERVYRDGVAKGVFVDMPGHVAVNGMLGCCNSIHTWFNPDGPLTVAEIATHHADLLANGVRVQRSGSAG